MKPDKERKSADVSRRSPFAICFIVFLLLTADYAYRFVTLLEQRNQLNRILGQQAQNAGGLAQGRELESRLEALSLELLQIARTNRTASNIVQEFNIQWTPGPAASAPAPAPAPGVPNK